MIIPGFQKTTLLDYPGHTAALVFTGGCNFRCPYCHNGDLVLHPGALPPVSEEEIFAHLKKRRNVLNGVSVTGGEPTLQADLPAFFAKIKDLGYEIKLDTNGTSPGMLRKLLEEKLVDYVAMDIKNAPEKYGATVGLPPESFTDSMMDDIRSSIALLREWQVDYEFRTTVMQELHSVSDIEAIGEWIAGAKRYFIQPYKESDAVIRPGFTRPSEETLKEMAAAAGRFIPEVQIRG